MRSVGGWAVHRFEVGEISDRTAFAAAAVGKTFENMREGHRSAGAWRGFSRWVAIGLIATGATTWALAADDPKETRVRPEAAEASAGDVKAEVRRRLRARLPEAADGIQVVNRNGQIVLTGTVDVLPKKQMAAEAAEGVRGVEEVANELTVAAEQRPDQEIARDVKWALKSDPATFGLEVEVAAQDGVVTLRGTVETVPQKRIAAWVASGLRGVREIENEIRVALVARDDLDIRDELVRHFATSATFNDDEIAVEVTRGVVRLFGEVDSALEKNWARDEAWIRGVQRVTADGLEVNPSLSLSHAGAAKPLTDDDIRQTIVKALVFDPRVASVDAEVGVADHVVTLRGVVSNRKAKQAAVQIARNTGGVTEVIDRLRVESDVPRSDVDIANAIRTALETSAALAGDELDVRVENGRVALSGAVDSHYDKWVASDLADRTRGVVEVDNQLAVRGAIAAVSAYYYPRAGATTPWGFAPPAEPAVGDDAQLAAGVRRELAWSPFTDGEEIRIRAEDGVVTLSGEVESWTERGAAIENAYQAGARGVVDQLRIAASP